MPAATVPRTLCIAWVTMSGRELTGRYRDRYRTEPIFRPALQAFACVWACQADAKDTASAYAYAKAHGYAVFPVGDSERDPLALARAYALHLHHQGKLPAV